MQQYGGDFERADHFPYVVVGVGRGDKPVVYRVERDRVPVSAEFAGAEQAVRVAETLSTAYRLKQAEARMAMRARGAWF